MPWQRFKKFFKRKAVAGKEIDPDEIFLDSSNLPQFDRDQFEGRLEKPIARGTVVLSGVFFLIVGVLFLSKIWVLQVSKGEAYSMRSENNRLRHTLVFGERGIVYDRNSVLLAQNAINEKGEEFSRRMYLAQNGLAHVLGYVKYPSKDSAGFYYKQDFEGIDGIEKFYNESLSGKQGLKIVETDALGNIQSESVLEPPLDGENLVLSIDARLNAELYRYIDELSKQIGFSGGAAALMDIETGELLALVSYPEYDSNALTNEVDQKMVERYIKDEHKPFLNRAVDGLYTPGSIVKPFLALAALNEKLIEPRKEIVSTGSISLPNPYDPAKKSVFTDWKAHGAVDMRRAIAVSSNVYFYEIGGGFENQKGLGIEKIEQYMRLFGFGESRPSNQFFTKKGVIPNPEWKRQNFQNDLWRIGDTYNTSIGQYGFQITLMQALRAVSAIGNDGMMVEPTIVRNSSPDIREIPFDPEHYRVVKEGMRLAVTDGTAKGMNIPQVAIAAKTGTAELGVSKKYVNSWAIGFLPHDKPKVAFAAIMEKGPRDNTIGALYVMRQMLEWMAVYTPEYFR